ncbi:uncharacterized protein LOC129737670 [Uranotaenia lowii]|uniref:uncharacterized protein LOC129737670 n=1 Tax=Uranotaenia lowii TaxID=190385 RepID=UPI00247B1194|nr:uncharacterized protein LOC129737670 [Uranotaenia lowii]
MEETIKKRNNLFEKIKWELETARKVETRNPPVCEVRERLSRLHTLGTTFFDIQDEIEEQTESLEAVASVFNYRTEFEDRYYAAKAIYSGLEDSSDISEDTEGGSSRGIKNAIETLIQAQQVLLSSQATVSTRTNELTVQLNEMRQIGFQGAHPADQQLNVRLPPINIPIFKGNRKEWQSFKDLYTSTIHNKPTLPNSQKLQYLLSYLDGEAKSLVNSFTITDANYLQVWERLLERYDKPKYTVFALVKEFLDQPAVTSSSNQVSLQKLVTTSDEVIRQLDAMGEAYRTRDAWLIHLLLEKIDKGTRAQWAQKIVELENPTFQQFLAFLENRCDALETCSSFTNSKSSWGEVKKEVRIQTRSTEKKVSSYHTTPHQCSLCSEQHQLYHCKQFLQSTTATRRELVQKSNLCFNCLLPAHSVRNCTSKTSCRNERCKQRHHTLLCQLGDSQESMVRSTFVSSSSNFSIQQPESETQPSTEVSSFKAEINPSETTTKISVLPTALIRLRNRNGSFQLVRAMIDSGSGTTLISEACVSSLGLSRNNARLPVTGVAGAKAGTTKRAVRLEIASRFNDDIVLTTQAYILEVLASPTPCQRFDTKQSHFLRDLPLADPGFNKLGPIDVILGVEVFLPILQAGQVTDEDGLPVAQRSVLGWLVAGRISGESSIQTQQVSYTVQLDVNIDRALRSFWETEEIPAAKLLTADEQRVVELFETTHKRNETGRFVVRLPFDETKPALGESLNAAVKRLHSMERRFIRNPSFKQHYVDFMAEYQQLSHMELVPSSEVTTQPSKCFYLPHHAVEKHDSATTKLRVVFDGSSKTSTGVSLNDRLLVGPNNTEDLFDVLCRFRTYPIVFMSDVEKMYRQVLVDDQDTDYQRIVWREDPEQPIQHYRLKTVTYGTSSAAYLATEALKQAARDCAEEYHQASQVILKGSYVDDIISGARSIEEAKNLVSQIRSILEKAGFKLRKWSSNNPQLLDSLTDTRDGPIPIEFISSSNSIKALGIRWSPSTDCFDFKVSLDPTSVNTKRQLLSDASKIFDPFGWLSSTIVKVKILFQPLWLHDLSWDDPLPAAIEQEWITVKHNLLQLEEIKIPRFITNDEQVQLIGFCDASESAYAAVVYGRWVNESGDVQVNLIAAKTKVAPIKQITLPRLELNAAVLLSKLINKISNSLSHLKIETFVWTDSTAVLEWLSSHPKRWKNFVANRTSTILDTLPRSMWHHVSSKDNPADCASRGIPPIELVTHDLWWTGPSWLYDEASFLEHINTKDTVYNVPEDVLEQRPAVAYVTTVQSEPMVAQYILERYSSLRYASRILASINRYVNNVKANCKAKKTIRIVGALTPDELSAANLQLAKVAQQDVFGPELKALQNGAEVGRRSKLKSLHPFIDGKGILRVGGRLQNANIPYEMKHPVILPRDHRYTLLLIQQVHLDNLHAGPTLLIATLNQRYWVIGCQTIVRQQTSKCPRCCRMKAKTAVQLMGSLPAVRMMPVRAFIHVGIDYAGPIFVKSCNPRKPYVSKGYIVVIVCLSTKAIHLELASDLSSNGFLLALKRFIARRGLCTEIWSDNGTNFVGADNQLQGFFQSNEFKQRAERFSSNVGIKWTFITPSAPHMGGLWEAAVKSAKTHLYKVLKNEKKTYEELYTILTQTEACLNSRPLCALSSSPDSCDALTPGHFIIGQPLNLLPEPGVPNAPINRLDKFQVLQKQVADVWSRWKDEYITSLQPRTKWQSPADNLRVGQLVLVKNENIPPGQWELARIITVHPDPTGSVRNVTLRRGSTEYDRPIHRLVPIPSD